MLQSVVDADAQDAAAARQRPRRTGRRRPGGRHGLRRRRASRQGVEPYDETITSERIIAVGDLYYLYQHEKIGVFRVVQKLQELFRAGAVRLSGGPGAFALYQFDRREVLRYTMRDRLGGLPPRVRLRQRPGAHRLARRTPTSTSCSRTSSTR